MEPATQDRMTLVREARGRFLITIEVTRNKTALSIHQANSGPYSVLIFDAVRTKWMISNTGYREKGAWYSGMLAVRGLASILGRMLSPARPISPSVSSNES